jgi:predicted transcriptional regulator
MSSSFRHFLEHIAKEKAPGPSPAFSVFHLLLAIELVAENPIGRGKLAQNLGVGEGVIRTILGRLTGAGLITTSKAGCKLTKRGLGIWKEYSSIVRKVEIGKNELTDASHTYAILVKDHGHRLKSGMEQRDAAVMAGAKTATTMLYKARLLKIPSVTENAEKDFPKASDRVLKLLKPVANDAIVIVGADNQAKAVYAAMAAAWTLLNT